MYVAVVNFVVAVKHSCMNVTLVFYELLAFSWGYCVAMKFFLFPVLEQQFSKVWSVNLWGPRDLISHFEVKAIFSYDTTKM